MDIINKINLIINETIQSGSFPNTDGIASADDHPTGNILMGDKFISKKVKSPYLGIDYKVWEPTNDYKSDWFESAKGQEKIDHYSDTLKTGFLKKYNNRLFQHMKKTKTLDLGDNPEDKARNKEVPDNEMDNVNKDVDKPKKNKDAK